MEERTRTKLTKFSRLWPVPLVLFIVLCIVAVIACINENKDLMGIAAIGTILMFVIMLCQLVTSIIVRRWWYLVGVIVSIAVSLFVWLCSIVLLAAGQYRPPKRPEPSIIDIMNAITHQEACGELLGYIDDQWQLHEKGLEYSGDFLIDTVGDYIMYTDRQEDGDFVWTDTTEFRSWEFESSSDKLVAVAHRDYTNGKVSAGQYSGLSFYIFDGDTIEWIPDDTLGMEYPEIDGLIVYWLSGDADITLSASNPEEGTSTKLLDWDGNKFVIKENRKEP